MSSDLNLDMNGIENIKFDANGLVPAVAQNFRNKEVLMLAYMNREALEKTLTTGQAHYFSRSRQELWHKGATSGHFQNVKGIRYDCDGDTVLLLVDQIGAACHTGNRSCFFRTLEIEQGATDATTTTHKSSASNSTAAIGDALTHVYDVIVDRRNNPKEGSYTNYLFEKGLCKVLKKVGEESTETVIAALNGDKDELAMETADLLYHLSVMLVQSELSWENVARELRNRQ